MPSILKLHQPINFEDFTLILPSVSVGNVPQLAIDVIISTYKLKYAGIIYHPAFIPMIGRNSDLPNDGIEASTACELYALEASKIAVLQIRSGIHSSRANHLFADLSNLIASCQFKETIILTSAFAYENPDVKSNPFRYSGTFDPFKNEIKKLDDSHEITGSGFARALLKVLSQVTRIALVLQYTSEGDNTADVLRMIDLLRRSTEKLPDVKYEIPIPWQFVYGTSAPMIIY